MPYHRCPRPRCSSIARLSRRSRSDTTKRPVGHKGQAADASGQGSIQYASTAASTPALVRHWTFGPGGQQRDAGLSVRVSACPLAGPSADKCHLPEMQTANPANDPPRSPTFLVCGGVHTLYRPALRSSGTLFHLRSARASLVIVVSLTFTRVALRSNWVSPTNVASGRVCTKSRSLANSSHSLTLTCVTLNGKTLYPTNSSQIRLAALCTPGLARELTMSSSPGRRRM
jgi:hypothetical protein